MLCHVHWDGISGDAYSLDYAATVLAGDPSGFGGTQYFLHYEGIVTVKPVPLPAAVWLLGPGLIGLALSADIMEVSRQVSKGGDAPGGAHPPYRVAVPPTSVARFVSAVAWPWRTAVGVINNRLDCCHIVQPEGQTHA